MAEPLADPPRLTPEEARAFIARLKETADVVQYQMECRPEDSVSHRSLREAVLALYHAAFVIEIEEGLEPGNPWRLAL